MSELDRFVGSKDYLVQPLPSGAQKPGPVVTKGEPDRVVGRLKASRKAIVAKVLSAGVVCLDCAPEGSDLTEPNRVRVHASDLPAVGQYVIRVPIVRCDVCGRVWDVMRREWAREPEPIEERK